MKSCLHCKYADWNRTGAGKLHPSGDGRCRYEYVLLKLPASMYWVGSFKAPTPAGGHINRKEELEEDCVYWNRKPND